MEQVNAILNALNIGIVIFTPEGDIRWFNHIANTFTKTVLGKELKMYESIFSYHEPHRSKSIQEILKNLSEAKVPEQDFVTYTIHQKATLYIEYNYLPILDGREEVTEVYQLMIDITSQKNFEKRIQSEASNVNQLIEKANAIIIGIDTRGYITKWNECASKITGFEKNQVYAQKLIEILLPDKEQVYFSRIVERILSKESLSNFEMSLRTSRGRLTTALLSATPRTNALDEVVGAVFVGQDITELIAYRKSLEQKVDERTYALQEALEKEKKLVEMRTRFVSIASHEFRSPLASLQHAATIIKEKVKSNNDMEIQDKLATIDKQINHMTVLLDDVLTYGKAETSKINVTRTTILLKDFFVSLFEEVGHNTKNTHSILANLEDLPETILSDTKLLRNIFINLLTNAIKYSPGKRQLFFDVVNWPNALQISIRDEGIGIKQEDKERIFEPFTRGEGVEKIQGTGLGLSIVKRAVELLEARIHVQSEPSVGTTFTIVLSH